MDNKKISITFEMSNEKAEALALFLKRCNFADYYSKAEIKSRSKLENTEEAYMMQNAG